MSFDSFPCSDSHFLCLFGQMSHTPSNFLPPFLVCLPRLQIEEAEMFSQCEHTPFYLELEDPPQIHKDIQDRSLQWKLLGMKAEWAE